MRSHGFRRQDRSGLTPVALTALTYSVDDGPLQGLLLEALQGDAPPLSSRLPSPLPLSLQGSSGNAAARDDDSISEAPTEAEGAGSGSGREGQFRPIMDTSECDLEET